MKLCGADLVVRALEDAGARFTFGIPGTHNIELYDALERSGRVTPVLVTDEQSASFMADGVSRTSDTIGVVEVAIDYSRKTYFTRGVVATTLRRLPFGDRLRMLGRAAARHVAGAISGRLRED